MSTAATLEFGFSQPSYIICETVHADVAWREEVVQEGFTVEVESRGEEIYEQQIRQNVEPGNKGKFVVIDIETGEYEVDEGDLRATRRALAKRSKAILYGVRIGYPTAYTLGGHIAMDVQNGGSVTIEEQP